jgi:hypothetical protein
MITRLHAFLWLALVATLPHADALAQQQPFQTQTFTYTPPDREPKGVRNRYVDEGADAVFQQIWANLEERQLTIASVNPQERIVIAHYSGDPRPYMDCGTVTVLVDGEPTDPPKQFAAAKAELRTTKTANKRRYGLLRQLNADIRLVVRVEPRGKGSRVYSEAIYVVTKTLHRVRKGGVPDEMVDRDVISFKSDERGAFEKGTICVGTGKFESMPLELFKKTS